MQILIVTILVLIVSNIFFIVAYYKKRYLPGYSKTAVDITNRTKLSQEELEQQNYKLKLEKLVEEKTQKLEEANQELQTLNEELDASNEEYQTINEELYTINEELKSSNEALSREIEEHTKTQAEKFVIEEKLNQFISQSSEAIVIINDKGIVEDWNETMAQITGITKENAIGKFIWDVTCMMSFDPDKAEFFRESFKNHTNHFFEEIMHGNRQPMLTESQIRHHDSTQRYIHTTLFPIITGSGNYGGVIILDITRRKTVEAQLENYRNELEKLLEQRTQHLEQLSDRFKEVYSNSSDAITFMDILDDGKTIKVFDLNPVSKQLFKISDERLAQGVYIENLLPEIKIDSFRQFILPKLLAGTSVSYTDDRDTGNGYWNSTIYPIKDATGKIYRIAAFSKNITAEYEHEKLSAILNSSIESWPYEFWVSNREGVCILQNKASQRIWGNLIGQKLTDLNTPDEVKQKSLEDESKALQGIPTCSELTFETTEGPRYVLVYTNPIVTKNEVTGLLGVIVDITHQKKIEIALKESEKRLDQLLSSITDFKFTVKIENDQVINTLHSEGCLTVTGYSPSEFQNNPYLWFEIVHLEDKQLLKDWAEKAERGIEVEPIEHRIVRKNGEIIWVSNTTVLKKDSEGKFAGFDGLISDITKRKNAELALRESEKRFYDAIDLQPLPMGIIIDGKPVFYNKNFTERFGYTMEDVPTVEKWIEYTISDNILREMILADVTKAIATRNNFEITKYNKDYNIRCKDGSYKWLEISDRKIGNMLVTVFNDITERKEAEKKIRESQEKLKTIFDTSKDGIVLLNKNMEITDINNSALKRSGYSKTEITGKNVFDFLVKSGRSSLFQPDLSIWDREVIDIFEAEVITKYEGVFPVEISASILRIDQQEMLLLMIRDISERRQLEKQLLQSVIDTEEKERINFSQELHDGLGPLLSAAKMYSEWLAEPGQDVDTKVIINDIQKLLEESTRTVKDISFKLSPHVLQNYGIVEALNAYSEKIEKTGKTQITIHGKNIGRFDKIKETIIYRVVCECINNSLKYAKASNIVISLTITDSFLNIDFSDDGIGFEVNKVSESHKGLGLFNIQSRLKSINGQFILQSEINSGTKIYIKVPVQMKIKSKKHIFK